MVHCRPTASKMPPLGRNRKEIENVKGPKAHKEAFFYYKKVSRRARQTTDPLPRLLLPPVELGDAPAAAGPQTGRCVLYEYEEELHASVKAVLGNYVAIPNRRVTQLGDGAQSGCPGLEPASAAALWTLTKTKSVSRPGGVD